MNSLLPHVHPNATGGTVMVDSNVCGYCIQTTDRKGEMCGMRLRGVSSKHRLLKSLDYFESDESKKLHIFTACITNNNCRKLIIATLNKKH